MNGLRNFFPLYAIAAATLCFIAVMHLSPLFSMAPAAVFTGDQLPEHVQIVSVNSPERHSPGTQNSHTLVKPAN